MSKFHSVRRRIATLATLGLVVGGIAATVAHASAYDSNVACAVCLGNGPADDALAQAVTA